MKIKRALILAAGYGKRLEPLTAHWPKCLMPVKKVPLLDYWLHTLYLNDFSEVVINTHHLSDEVEAFLLQTSHRNRVRVAHEKNY